MRFTNPDGASGSRAENLPGIGRTIGVLALQGGVEEHEVVLRGLGANLRRVRVPRDLEGLDGIVFPGGESSAIDKLARAFGLAEPLANAVRAGLPVFATCAGLIYCARELENPAPGQHTLGIVDATVRRNAFGNQRFSTERTLDVDLGSGGTSGGTSGDTSGGTSGGAVGRTPGRAPGHIAAVEASFIRAPIVTRVGDGVEVIARVPADSPGPAGEDFIVGMRSGNIVALSFHPEENGDSRVHAAWLRNIVSVAT